MSGLLCGDSMLLCGWALLEAAVVTMPASPSLTRVLGHHQSRVSS